MSEDYFPNMKHASAKVEGAFLANYLISGPLGVLAFLGIMALVIFGPWNHTNLRGEPVSKPYHCHTETRDGLTKYDGYQSDPCTTVGDLIQTQIP